MSQLAPPRNAVLLAAGEGSRLRPLTERIPKPLLPIDGEPVLGRVLRQVRTAGVTGITVVVGHRGEAVRRYVLREAPDLNPSFVEQSERRGTGHALQLALDAGFPHDDAIVAASDTAWRDEDVARLVNGAIRDRDADVTMALQRWPVAQLPHHSAVQRDEAGRVQRVLQRLEPAAGPPDATALSGSPLYVFRAAFWRRIADLQPTGEGVVQLADAIQAAIDDGRTVRGIEVAGARDLTRPEDLLRHNFPYLAPWLDEANAPS